MAFRSVLMLLVLFSSLSARDVRAQGGLLPRRGNEIKFNRGEPDSLMNRMLNFDLEQNIWLLGFDYPKNSNEEAIKKLKECFEVRRKVGMENKGPLLAIVRAESLVEGQNVPPQILDDMFGKAPDKLPDAKQRQELLTEYFKAETEAETLLSNQIAELLKPSEQFEFLAKPARLDAFLVHPIGQIYLHLSDSQKKLLRKQFQIRKSLETQRLQSTEQSKVRDKLKAEVESGKRSITLQVPLPSTEEIQARMNLFAILDEEQLVSLLRLNRTIKSDQGVADWIGALTGETQAIAKEIFAEYLK